MLDNMWLYPKEDLINNTKKSSAVARVCFKEIRHLGSILNTKTYK